MFFENIILDTGVAPAKLRYLYSYTYTKKALMIALYEMAHHTEIRGSEATRTQDGT